MKGCLQATTHAAKLHNVLRNWNVEIKTLFSPNIIISKKSLTTIQLFCVIRKNPSFGWVLSLHYYLCFLEAEKKSLKILFIKKKKEVQLICIIKTFTFPLSHNESCYVASFTVIFFSNFCFKHFNVPKNRLLAGDTKLQGKPNHEKNKNELVFLNMLENTATFWIDVLKRSAWWQ